MYDDRVFIFSRKKGIWIPYDNWMKSSLTNRINMTNIGIPAFPKKNTLIWKLQYVGACRILILQ